DLFQQCVLPAPDYQRYLRHAAERLEDNSHARMPPLDTTNLTIEALVLDQRRKLKTDVAGKASLLIRYRNYEGAVASLEELNNDEEWRICQIQGAKSQKSFRVTAGIHWQTLLAHRIRDYSLIPAAAVRHITMRPLHGIENIDGAESATVDATYQSVRSALQMNFSKELGLYIVDV